MTTLKIACASLLLLSGVMAASCSSDTETEAADRVEVSGLDDTVRFTYDAAESVAFTVASNKTWSIAKNGLDWLTVSQMNGGSKLPATVRLTAEANDDLERSGHLTIYAGALAQTVTVTQEACPVVPTITLGGLADNTIAFEFTDTEPVTFKLYANIDWTADKQNLGWAEVAPLSGARKQEATITVTPTANPGDAREGSVSFRAEGMEPVVVTVRQAAYRDEPMLVVTGADENRLAFANTPEAPTALHILCNRGWTITKTDLDWLTVSPAAGTASAEPAEVTLTAEPNDGAARSGTLTVRADDPALADVVITVSQAAKGNPLLAWWTLSDETLKTVNAGWPASGKILPDQPAGTTAYGQWNHVAQTPDYTTKLIISSDGKGHYAIQQIWTEDNMEFVIPVKNFAAGTSVNFRCGMSGTGTAPKYWSIDYFDQGEMENRRHAGVHLPDRRQAGNGDLRADRRKRRDRYRPNGHLHPARCRRQRPHTPPLCRRSLPHGRQIAADQTGQRRNDPPAPMVDGRTRRHRLLPDRPLKTPPQDCRPVFAPAGGPAATIPEPK